LAARGYAVFPVCDWGDGYKPIKSFPEKATADADQIRKWWSKWPHARLALLTGERNGITVLDVDVKHGKDGIASLSELGFTDPRGLSPSPTETPSAGLHLFFAYDDRLTNTIGAIGAGLDVRNNHAWVYAPGSWKDGRQYRPCAPLQREGLPSFPEALIPRQVRPKASAPTDENGCDDFNLESLQPPDWDRIREALSFIPADCGRDEWCNAGMALCHVDGGSDFARDIWDEWSQGDPKQYKKREIQGQWRSFRNDKASSVTIATLFHIAKGYGWNPTKPKTLETSLPLIDPAGWAGVVVPPREWALDQWIPLGQATYLTGPGSAGKSLLGQQLATCIALDIPFLGIETRQAKSLYLTCEDDAQELHRRQTAICASLGITLESLSGRLLLSSLAGEIGSELCTFSDNGVMKVSKRFETLESSAKVAEITFVVLDNVAHLFAGNENVRHEVAAFVSLLNRLAKNIGGTVLFVGHPNKAGDSFSGSTAWENQVRSRLFMETPQGEEGTPVDRDARTLSRQKSNYARNGESVAFRWHEWAFSIDRDLPDSVNEAALAELEDAAFLEYLAKTKARMQAVSISRHAASYAPRVFVKMPGGGPIGVVAFERAMYRLLDAGVIANNVPVYKRANRNLVYGLGLAQ
jgi:hypothetical protein